MFGNYTVYLLVYYLDLCVKVDVRGRICFCIFGVSFFVVANHLSAKFLFSGTMQLHFFIEHFAPAFF